MTARSVLDQFSPLYEAVSSLHNQEPDTVCQVSVRELFELFSAVESLEIHLNEADRIIRDYQNDLECWEQPVTNG